MAQAVRLEPEAVETGSPTTLPRMSYEEFLDWAMGRHAEWVDGEVIELAAASSRHQLLLRFLTTTLEEFIEAHEAGVLLFAPFQMKLSKIRRGREPDLLFIAQERTSLLTKTFLDGPADLAVEIASLDSQERDRVTKLVEYADGGVREYWLLDPETQEAFFYILSDSGTYDAVLPDADGVYHSTVLSGLSLPVAWFWQEPLPTMRFVREALGL